MLSLLSFLLFLLFFRFFKKRQTFLSFFVKSYNTALMSVPFLKVISVKMIFFCFLLIIFIHFFQFSQTAKIFLLLSVFYNRDVFVIRFEYYISLYLIYYVRTLFFIDLIVHVFNSEKNIFYIQNKERKK